MKGFETLRWRDGTLEMLDQRVLPATVQYLAYTSAAETAAGIRDMVVRGAPAIGVAAAYGVALEANRLRTAGADTFKAGLEAGFDVLAKSRPTAVNLFWALERMREEWQSVTASSQETIAEHLTTVAQDIHAADIAANRAMGRHGAALLANGARVLTHCNAGALATAGHGTALGVIRSAIEAGKSISVYADETRPFLQGARLTAWELMQDGIPVTLIADNAAAFLMSRGGNRWRGSSRCQWRCGEQDRHLCGCGSRQPPPDSVLCRSADLNDRCCDHQRRADSNRGAQRIRGDGLRRCALGAGRRQSAKSGLRCHAGGTRQCVDHRTRRGAHARYRKTQNIADGETELTRWSGRH